MRAFGPWLSRGAIAGICLALLGAGCGGGDVPDPDSDRNAARSDTPAPIARAAEPAAPAETPAAAETAPTDPLPAATAEGPAPRAMPNRAAAAGAVDPPPGRDAEKTAEMPKAEAETAPAPVTATKGDSSGTEELLRLTAANPAPGTSGEATPPASGAGGPTTSASGPAPGAMAGATPGEMARNREGGPAAFVPPARGAAAPNGPDPSSIPPPNAGFATGGIGLGAPSPGAPGGPGAPAGAAAPGIMGGAGRPGGPGGPAGGGGLADFGPKSFQTAAGAVSAFMAAVKAKDKERLKEAIAIRAPKEAIEKHRKIFAAIDDQTITDDELDAMARALEGYRPVSQLPAKSTGRIEIVVGKQAGLNYHQRTITTRKEKDGWKVLDVSDMLDFKPLLTPTFGRRGRGGN